MREKAIVVWREEEVGSDGDGSTAPKLATDVG